MKEDSYLIIALHRLVKDLDRETAAISSAHGLTLPQFAALEALLNKGSLTVGEIKEAVLSSNGTIPVVIGNLQKMGLVERTQDPADHRRSIVSLSKKGRTLIEQIAPENERMFREKFGVWTKGEKQELVRLLATYRKQMRTTHEE
jgi:MarR family 2-MHQ and catechol resistance regulon transcriptional repressor